MKNTVRNAIFLAATAVGLFISTPTTAQPTPTDAAKAEARQLADRGFELYEAADYKRAIELFQQAEARFSAPTIVLMIARAHAQMGELIEARDVYQRVVGATLTANAPKPFGDAQNSAKNELASIQSRIPTLRITVTGAPASVRVELNGVEIPRTALEQPIEKNPGTYTVMAFAAGTTSVFRSVTLEEGGRETVTLAFAVAALPRPAPQLAAPPANPGVSAETAAKVMLAPNHGPPPPSFLSRHRASFALAGTAVGLATAGAAVGIRSALDFGSWGTQCKSAPSTCPDPDAAPLKKEVVATDVLFGAAGAAAIAAGITFFEIEKKSDKKPKVAVTPTWGGGVITVQY